jgi:hypothetical protein
MPSPVAEYLSEVTLRLEDHLERRLAGAWLIGSGALGDFDTMRSDLDVQSVCTTRLARPELECLAAALSHTALPCPVRGLEFVLYAREDLSDSQGPAFQLNLNTGPGMEHHVGYDPDAEPRFWFVLDIAIARERARPLAGLPPGALLPAPSRPLVLSALRAALRWYRGYDGAEAVLAACRGWAWATEGRWLSKGDAAAWAAVRLSDPAPVAQGACPARRPRNAGSHTQRRGRGAGTRRTPARRTGPAPTSRPAQRVSAKPATRCNSEMSVERCDALRAVSNSASCCSAKRWRSASTARPGGVR